MVVVHSVAEGRDNITMISGSDYHLAASVPPPFIDASTVCCWFPGLIS